MLPIAEDAVASHTSCHQGAGRETRRVANILRVSFEKIPAAFIVTGTNIASQDLLFEQLSETLQLGSSRFVRLRSTEAGSLKAVLKRIIRTGTAKATDDDEEENTSEENESDVRCINSAVVLD